MLFFHHKSTNLLFVSSKKKNQCFCFSFHVHIPAPSSNYNKEPFDGSKYTTLKTDVGPPHKFKKNTKPPLAGPFAFSRIPKPFRNIPRVFLMHDISDTWLFLNVTSG